MKLKQIVLNNIGRLPNFVNEVLLRANRFPKLVYGRAYQRHRDRLQAGDLTFDELTAQLLAVTNHAIRCVAHYKDKYGAEKIESLEQFCSTLAFIDKNTIMQNWDSFAQPNLETKKYVMGTTGGTSGKPMVFHLPADRFIVELGSIHNFWSAFGFNHSPRAVLRSSRIKRDYQINPLTREYIFDGFELNDEGFANLYSVMHKKQIIFLHCYPSSAYEFALYLQKHRLDSSFIKAFLISSENMFPHQRELLRQMGIAYCIHYGHSEKLVLAANCPHADYYHPVAGYGYLELIDDQENVIVEEGVLGEIVGSTINNYGFPMLRYKTGDFAEYIHTDCACGFSGLSLKHIVGRWDAGKIYNADGSFITTTSLNLHNDLYHVIDGLQYVQNKKGELQVHIIPGSGYTDKHEERFYEHFRSKLAPDAKVVISHVDKLQRQANGKFLLLLSQLQD